MIVTFLSGCVVAAVLVAYALVGLYRGREPLHSETRLERALDLLTSVSWPQIVGIVLAGGLLAVVVVHGLDDVLEVVTAIPRAVADP